MAKKKTQSVLFQKPIEIPESHEVVETTDLQENIENTEETDIKIPDLGKKSVLVRLNNELADKNNYISKLEKTNVELNNEISKLNDQLELYIIDNETLKQTIMELSSNSINIQSDNINNNINNDEIIQLMTINTNLKNYINELTEKITQLEIKNSQLSKIPYTNGKKRDIIRRNLNGYNDWN